MPFCAFEAEHRNDKQESIHFSFAFSVAFWCGGRQFRIRVCGMINLNWQFAVLKLSWPTCHPEFGIAVQKSFEFSANLRFPRESLIFL
jgi:hypothetical protein